MSKRSSKFCEETTLLLRKCANPFCKKDLTFHGFMLGNYRLECIDHEYLLKIWESPYLQLFCCECNDKIKKGNGNYLEFILNEIEVTLK